MKMHCNHRNLCNHLMFSERWIDICLRANKFMLSNQTTRELTRSPIMRIGVIGYGYWGPNIVRNFSTVDGARVVAVCDLREDYLKKVEKNHPGVRTTTNCDELIRATDIDAVAVVTPVWTHFELAKTALENGKHVFVEKPFTSTVAAGRGADRAGRPEEPQDHGGPHVPLHRRGAEDQAS